jgi:HEAT repeat protein
VGKLGSAAATPEILAGLLPLLTDEDRYVRREAAMAVGKLGSAAATPEILAGLLPLLTDEDRAVRMEAAMAVGKLMAQGVRVFPRPDGEWEVKSVEELAREDREGR